MFEHSAGETVVIFNSKTCELLMRTNCVDKITERRTLIMTQSSTVDLRNRFIAVMIQKTW